MTNNNDSNVHSNRMKSSSSYSAMRPGSLVNIKDAITPLTDQTTVTKPAVNKRLLITETDPSNSVSTENKSQHLNSAHRCNSNTSTTSSYASSNNSHLPSSSNSSSSGSLKINNNINKIGNNNNSIKLGGSLDLFNDSTVANSNNCSHMMIDSSMKISSDLVNILYSFNEIIGQSCISNGNLLLI
jgi:hypothetical protein